MSSFKKSKALWQAEADVFADKPLVGCSRCVDLSNELYALRLQADQLRQVSNAADVVMRHFADSHWQEDSFAKMVDSMEPLRQALIASGYGLSLEAEQS